MITCGQCGGIGEVQDMEVRQHGRYQMQWATCEACNGTGRVPARAPVIDPETRGTRFDGPLTGLVRAGWVSERAVPPRRLEVQHRGIIIASDTAA